MRYAVISDVHSNLEALHAVFNTIEKTVDYALFLGDCIGYGPNPNECVAAIREKSRIMIAGNHDRAAVGMISTGNFNSYARTAVIWTHNVLNDENRVFLQGIPLIEKLSGILLVHGTPLEPERWHYLTSENTKQNFHSFSEQICLLGHSHVPVIIEQSPEAEITRYTEFAEIKKGHRYIVNAGSVGQPRDGNPDAAYALLDENSIEIKRVSYDIVSTQKKMRNAGLPSFLIDRLSKGM